MRSGQSLAAIDSASARVSRVLAIIAAALIVVALVVMLAEVVNRIVMGRSIAGAYETVVALVVVISFLGLPHSERTDATVRVQLLSLMAPKALVPALRTLGGALAVAVAAWIALATGSAAFTSLASGEYSSGLVDFPLWPARLVICVGSALFAMEIALRTVRQAMDAPEDSDLALNDATLTVDDADAVTKGGRK